MVSLLQRIGPLALLVSLIAATLLLKHGTSSSSSTIEIDTTAARQRYGFYFKEVAKAIGIDFVHTVPTFDRRLAHIMPQIASIGASVSVVDFDRDGWYDLYLTNSGEGSQNALYRNLGNGRFEDVAALVGLADVNRPGTGVSVGAVWGDYNNDGYEDLFLYKWGRPELFRNEQGRTFTRVTEEAGLPAWANIGAATWLDFDNDGYLDLFFGGFYPEQLNLWELPHTAIMPESFEYAQNGGRKFLLRNRGDGTFEDVSYLLGPDTHRWMLAVAAVDVQGTGYPDLIIANDYGVDELYLNDKGTGFRAAGAASGIGFIPKSGMGVAVGDIFNDGRLALYISNIFEDGILLQGNSCWVPRTSTPTPTPQYVNLARTLNIEQGGWSYGAQFGDLNNDGYLDLFLTNGYISAHPSESYWYDFSKIVGAHKAIIQDARNWPAMRGRSLAGYQPKRVWLNDGSGRFWDVAQEVGVRETYDGRGVALVDLWNRGVLDVVVAHQNGPVLVYRNMADPLHQAWIAFELEGRLSNRSAFGAVVTVYWNGQQQRQPVMASSGFAAQNMRRLHFGLGQATQVDSVVVRWPSGHTQTLVAPALRTTHRLHEALDSV